MRKTRTDTNRETRLRLLVERTERDILSYAMRRVNRLEDAADVVAETYLVAWRKIDRVPEGDAARLWLYGVARRHLANLRRGHTRRENLSDRLKADLAAKIPFPGGEGASDREAEISEALSKLSEEDREILTLFAWDELQPAEIATVMGIRGPTARSRLHRAKVRLKAELAQEKQNV